MARTVFRTLLVLGSSGFLGPHVVAAGVRGGAGRVVGVSRSGALSAPVLHDSELVEERALDLREEGALEALFADVRPTAVVNAAALSRMGDCARDPELALELNATVAGRIAAASREHGARLLHVSTDLVFGAVQPYAERYSEADPPAATSEYGRSKIEGEERVIEAHPDALVARLPLLFGDSGGRGLGASDGLLAQVQSGETPGLFRDEWRTPLEVGQAAEALLEALGLGLTGFLHVAGPERISRYDLGIVVLRAAGYGEEAARELVQETTRSRAGVSEERPADASLDGRRARGLLAAELFAPSRALSRRVP